MSKILYRTRMNSSPWGKPKVYFACHPNDFAKHFETISREILLCRNCAVYYDSEPVGEIDWVGHLAFLGEMDLIVAPITSNLLTSSSRVDVEIPFAREMRIPILPLMQGSGLEEQFSERYGDLLYLKPGEKLRKYLSQALKGNTLSGKPRDLLQKCRTKYTYLYLADCRAQETQGTVQDLRGPSVAHRNSDPKKVLRQQALVRETHRKYLPWIKLLADVTGTVEAQLDLAYDYICTGKICAENPNVPEIHLRKAEAYYLRSVAVSKPLAEETGNIRARRILATGYENLGKLCLLQDRRNKTKKYFSMCYSLRKQLADETGESGDLRGVSHCFGYFGDIRRARGKTAQAIEYYEYSLALSTQLAEKTDAAWARDDLVNIYRTLCQVCKETGDRSQEKIYYNKYIELLRNPKVGWKETLSYLIHR